MEIRTTVYPSRANAFPAASFTTFKDALLYIFDLQDSKVTCGICSCPAESFTKHYIITLLRSVT